MHFHTKAYQFSCTLYSIAACLCHAYGSRTLWLFAMIWASSEYRVLYVMAQVCGYCGGGLIPGLRPSNGGRDALATILVSGSFGSLRQVAARLIPHTRNVYHQSHVSHCHYVGDRLTSHAHGWKSSSSPPSFGS